MIDADVCEAEASRRRSNGNLPMRGFGTFIFTMPSRAATPASSGARPTGAGPVGR
jgi:hypothetical protein